MADDDDLADPGQLLLQADRQVRICRWLMDGKPDDTAGIDPDTTLDPDPDAAHAADGADGPAAVAVSAAAAASANQPFEAAAAARRAALAGITGSSPLVLRLLRLSQKALALAVVDSNGVSNVALAQRHYELGKLYLSLGWPAAALAQSDKARDVNKQLLVRCHHPAPHAVAIVCTTSAEQQRKCRYRRCAPPEFAICAGSCQRTCGGQAPRASQPLARDIVR